jgi:NTE family protein
VAPEGLLADDFINPPGFIGWTMKHGFKSAPPIANLLMRAATISVNPNQHRNLTDILVVPQMKDIELRDWKDYDSAVEAGYNDMKQALADVKGPLAQIIRGNAAVMAE